MCQRDIPVVSIIVPIHNTAPYMEDCISSVLNQSFSAFELILIDDASTDDSLAICERMCQGDARIRLISLEENLGVSYARNKGIDSAIGKYLFFLDSDDMIYPKLLEEGARQADSSGADLLLFERFFSDQHSPAEWEAFCRHAPEPEWHTLSEEDLWKNWGAFKRRYDVGGKFFLREAVSDLRFDERIYSSEDYLFNYSFLIGKPRRIVYTDLPGYYYRVRGESAWHDLQLEGLLQTLEARRRIIESELHAGREKNAVFDEEVCISLIRDWYDENRKKDETSADKIKKFIREDRNRVLFQKIPRTKRWSFFLCINCPGLFHTLKSARNRRSDNVGERT